MEAYEFQAKVTPDGRLVVPEAFAPQLLQQPVVRRNTDSGGLGKGTRYDATDVVVHLSEVIVYRVASLCRRAIEPLRH